MNLFRQLTVKIMTTIVVQGRTIKLVEQDWNYLKGMLRVVIDGTFTSLNRSRTIERFNGIWINTYMVFVNTSLEVALYRPMKVIFLPRNLLNKFINVQNILYSPISYRWNNFPN